MKSRFRLTSSYVWVPVVFALFPWVVIDVGLVTTLHWLDSGLWETEVGIASRGSGGSLVALLLSCFHFAHLEKGDGVWIMG